MKHFFKGILGERGTLISLRALSMYLILSIIVPLSGFGIPSAVFAQNADVSASEERGSEVKDDSEHRDISNDNDERTVDAKDAERLDDKIDTDSRVDESNTKDGEVRGDSRDNDEGRDGNISRDQNIDVDTGTTDTNTVNESANQTRKSDGNSTRDGERGKNADETREQMVPTTCEAQQKTRVISEGNGSEQIVTDKGPEMAVSAPVQKAWTAVIPTAFWIWSPEGSVTGNEVTFSESFSIRGNMIASAVLSIAADSTYKVSINGTTVASSGDRDNYSFETQDTYADLVPYLNPAGDNTILISVTKSPDGTRDEQTRPQGGLLYDLSIAHANCADIGSGDDIAALSQFQVHTYKFVDGMQADSSNDKVGNFKFTMSETILAPNVNSGQRTSSTFMLGTGHGGMRVPYSAKSVSLDTGSYYKVQEITSDIGKVSGVKKTCEAFPCAADFNDDGIVNGIDLGILLNDWTVEDSKTPTENMLGDLNNDGAVNGIDLGILLNSWTVGGITPEGGLIADLNGDNSVDGIDLGVLLNNWTGIQTDTPPTTGGTVADLNDDGVVNGIDLGILLNSWGACGYFLEGYSVGTTLEEAVAAKISLTEPEFTDLTSDMYVVVWNSTCAPETDDNGNGNGDSDTDPTDDDDDSDNGNGSGGGGGGGSGSSGSSSNNNNNGNVLGASTGQVLGDATCAPYLSSYIKFGANNDPAEVMKLQVFLNKFTKANLPITGFYGEATRNAVNRFQTQFKLFVLRPWVEAGLHANENEPTGYVYITTKRWINALECPTTLEPIPTLKLG